MLPLRHRGPEVVDLPGRLQGVSGGNRDTVRVAGIDDSPFVPNVGRVDLCLVPDLEGGEPVDAKLLKSVSSSFAFS
jgi:hypothetical protein